MYTVYLYDAKENRFFCARYLYYTKKEIRAKAKKEYPHCEIVRMERMDAWV